MDTLPLDNITLRYTIPTRFDQAPQFTLCKVIDNNNQTSFYLQLSNNKEHPSWIKMGDLLEQAFSPYFSNPNFIKICISKQNIINQLSSL